MKYLKNIVAVLVLVGIFHMSYSAELSVDEINVVDANTLSVTLSENPNLENGPIEAEIRVLNDVKLRGALKSEASEVELILEDAMKPETTYSLLTLVGADGSIDFTTPSNVEGYTASNIASVEEQSIEWIEIIDDRTIIITYINDIIWSSFEYKLLAESKVVSIEKPDFFLPEIIISVEPPFVWESDYILMFIEMQDASGEFLEFDTGIYDFSTWDMVEWITSEYEIQNTNEGEDTLSEQLQVVKPEVVEEEIINGQYSIQEEEQEVEFNAAGEQSWLVKDTEMIDTDIAAEMMQETPDTGAATWVLILATLFINSFYYLSRRKKIAVTA